MFIVFSYLFISYEPDHEKKCLMPYANNKGADQPVHPPSLISIFVVRCQDRMIPLVYTGHSRYVDFAYLDTTTYAEVIFHSQHFFSIFLCISTPSMSKTVNMKQWVSRGDFSCPKHIFYYNCYCLYRSIKSALAWAPYCLFRLCTCIS